MKKKAVCAVIAGAMAIGGAAPAYATPFTHTVEWGDTLGKLSKQYGTTIEALAEANGIRNPNRIYVGDELQIPEGAVGQMDFPLAVNEAEKDSLPADTVLEQQAQENAENEEIDFPSTGEAMRTGIDTAFTQEVMYTIGSYGDDPVMGNRSAGSNAEYQAASYIKGRMEAIGLQNVTEDQIQVDTWSFNGASITLDMEDGPKTIHLGGYATHLVMETDAIGIVYVGKGTEVDYEALDVAGKLVLVDIDQYNEWWINWPAYQAKLKGAVAVIAVNVDGYAQFDGDTTGSQDICGPADAPAFAISKNGANLIKEAIAKSGESEIQVGFQADSVVKANGASQNIWGEIPGKSDEVIYYIAHYDGYYHSVFDDASGVATILTIAKTMLESGYTPERTIRFVTHGAEEWGKIDSAYDWAMGAYEQIMTVHPEWAEKAFALINVDGCYPLPDETVIAVNANYELYGFLEDFGDRIRPELGFKLETGAPGGTYTEDFIYNRAGVPSIIAVSSKGSTSVYRMGAYHSSADAKERGFNSDYSEEVTYMFMAMGMELDRLAVKPIDYAAHIQALRETMNEGLVGRELMAAADAAYVQAAAIGEKLESINNAYAFLKAAGSTDEGLALLEKSRGLNYQLYQLYKQFQRDFVRLGWEENLVAPHEQYQENIFVLEEACALLIAGDAETVLDDLLYGVDYNWYAYFFDKECYTYFADQYRSNAGRTFGEGLLVKPNEDLFDVIRSLKDKAAEGNEDFTHEIKLLENALDNQQRYLDEIREEELADLTAFTKALTELNQELDSFL